MSTCISEVVGSPLSAEEAEATARVLKALADPVRIRLLSLISAHADGQACVCDLLEAFDLSQPTVSHHLKVLFNAGLVVRHKDGAWVYYRTNPAALQAAAAAISGHGSTSTPHPTSHTTSRQVAVEGDTVERVLQRGVDELAFTFAGAFSHDIVDRYVHESYQTLYRTSRVKTHLPVLALRFATERLRALAQASGRVAKVVPEVLFVCTHNAGRSQLAAALLTELGGGRVHARSAGSSPGEGINPAVAHLLTERGLTLPDEFPKPLTDDVVRAADVVVTMGCGDTCPIYPGKRYLDWDLPDPDQQPLEVVRTIADQIETKVRQLLSDLAIEPTREEPA
jgi:ArsR family transcriptional regulator